MPLKGLAHIRGPSLEPEKEAKNSYSPSSERGTPLQRLRGECVPSTINAKPPPRSSVPDSGSADNGMYVPYCGSALCCESCLRSARTIQISSLHLKNSASLYIYIYIIPVSPVSVLFPISSSHLLSVGLTIIQIIWVYMPFLTPILWTLIPNLESQSLHPLPLNPKS